VLIPEFDRFSGCIEWIDLSFVERKRTPGWAIQVGIQCHLAGMSTRYASHFFDELGVQRSHVAVHNWVHKADLQPLSTVTADQLAVDEKVIRINGDDYWLYGAVDPETNKILQFRLFPTTTKQTTRWFLTELHRRYRLDGVEFLVDDADHLVNVLDEDGYRFQMISHGNRNAIKRIFWEMKRRTLSFATSFSSVNPQTAESWLQALAVRHNSRQS
jgi:transposase-like protein